MTYVNCPHCGATLSVPDEYKNDKRLHCSQCNQNFENDKNFLWQASKEEPRTSLKQNSQTGWTKQQKRGLWVLTFCICIVLYHCGAFESTGTPQIGDSVVVVEDTWGTSDRTNDEFMNSAMANDSYGIYEQVRMGRAKFIRKGTRGKIIQLKLKGGAQIRFDDYSLYWISPDAVKKE